MRLEATEAGLRIIEEPNVFELELPSSASPLEELLIRGALAIVVRSPESPGAARAIEILSGGDESAALLSLKVCGEFLKRTSDG